MAMRLPGSDSKRTTSVTVFTIFRLQLLTTNGWPETTIQLSKGIIKLKYSLTALKVASISSMWSDGQRCLMRISENLTILSISSKFATIFGKLFYNFFSYYEVRMWLQFDTSYRGVYGKTDKLFTDTVKPR
jgi:hypothetical protein